MLKLHPVNHAKGDTNRYCGPSAISAVTGITTGEAARLIRSGNHKASVQGTSNGDVTRALHRLGIGAFEQGYAGSHTLASWLKHTHGARGGRVFLIAAGHHWQLVSGNRYVCGLSKDVVELTHPQVKRRARVEIVYELRTKAGGIVIPADIRKPKAKPAVGAAARAKAKALAAKIGVEIDRHTDLGSDYYYVSHPDLIDTPADPHDGDHYAHTWEDILDRVKDYERALAA